MIMNILFSAKKFGSLVYIMVLFIGSCKNESNIRSKGYNINAPDGTESYRANILFKEGNRKQVVLIVDNNASPKTVSWEVKADGNVKVHDKMIKWIDGISVYFEDGDAISQINSTDARLLGKLIYQKIAFDDIMAIKQKGKQ